MKNIKRRLALLLSASMIVTLFAGCSNSTTGEKKDDTSKTASEQKTEDGKSEGKTVINFWHSFSSSKGELLDQMIKEFNDTHDDIEVVGTYQGDYWESASKAQTAISSGENPDILMMGADHVSIFENEEGLLEDLTPYMKESGIDESDFVDAFSWDYKVNGQFLAIPFGRSTPVMYVNKDILKEEGLKVPTNWDELKDVANKLVKKDGDEVSRYGVAMPYDTWYFFMVIAQAGGSFINSDKTAMGCIDDGTGVAALTYLQDLKNSNGLYFGPTSDSDATCKQLFLDGKAAMYISSVGNLKSINDNASFDYELDWVPEGKKRIVPTGGCSVVMMAASEHKDAAWEFLKWYIQDPKGGAFIVANTGYLPFTKSMTESEPIKKIWEENPNAKTAYEQLQYASDKDHRIPQIGSVLNDIFTAEQAIMYDNEDVKTQLDILNEAVKTTLED